MARSPSHRFGQIIGDLLEASIEPLLREFADSHGVYLDKKGVRPARRGSKCTWIDVYGNAHDLDYVFERGGTPEVIGTPVAFIETAWRRYTKHSRNKAQEIQGAILPLVATHQHSAPFMGAILAGVFTANALAQLKSLEFKVLYFPSETVIKAFKTRGIDATSNESTPDADLAMKVAAWDALSLKDRNHIARALLKINETEVGHFMESLAASIGRTVEGVHVLPLHGSTVECTSVAEAIDFIEEYASSGGGGPTVRYEVLVRYNNGDRIDGNFADKSTAIDFLRSYEPPPIRPATARPARKLR